MNHSDSELEEGEILDDSPPSPKFNNNNKRKELPQRYTIGDNKKSMHKHKKGCRHAIRYHAKKLSKLKKTPTRIKDNPKQYHKPTCIYEKSHKFPGRYNSSDTAKRVLPKKNHFPQNSLISEMKDSFKNVSPFNKLTVNADKPKPQNVPFIKGVFNVSESELFASEISSAKMLENDVDSSEASNAGRSYDHLSERTDSNLSKISDVAIIEISSSDSNQDSVDLSKSQNDGSNIIHLNSDNDNVKNVNYVSTNCLQVKHEESEDEEELRRLALATCAKRKALAESENTLENIEYLCSIVPIPDLSLVNNGQISHEERINPSSDNYEVVDMEVDEEGQDSLEIVETTLINQEAKNAEECFFIDTNPSNDLLQNTKNSFSELCKVDKEICNSSDEDFEVDILRAELLNNMFRKKLLQDDLQLESEITSAEQKMPVVQPKKPLVNLQSPNLMFRNKRLKSAKHFLRKRSVNKLESTKNNKILLPVQTSKPPERLIITVNGESSDDSDSSDEGANAVSENPVDSIVALISDCRQKSECSIETKDKESVPKAVSCLSKAQQEEYNSLMKILAKNKKLPVAQRTFSLKNGLVYSPSDDLKKLDEKLVLYQAALKNKKDSMTLMIKEIKLKNAECKKVTSTLQLLKRQLIAAEKVRKAKVLELSKSYGNLKLIKQNAANLMKKINEVTSLRSKLQGQSYNLPLLSDNKQS